MNMAYDTVLIRFGELTLKGKNRGEFISQLKRNLKRILKDYPSLVYISKHDRIFIELKGVDGFLLEEKIKTVFGISSFSLTKKCPNDLDEMAKTALALVKDKADKSFKIQAHRSDKRFPFVSDQINRFIAANILKNTSLMVDVKNPDILIRVEVREDYCYISDNKISGAQGFPVGSSSKALLLLSGGIDSPVAGYLGLKRGLHLECIHFESQPYTSPAALIKVFDLIKQLTVYQERIKLHIVPFAQMQRLINDNVTESYRITIMRRMMMRISMAVAINNNCEGLINGESIGQVASQTLQSLKVIGAVVNLPIIRPLITYDKQEIINLAKDIITYDISCRPYPDCCTVFTPKNPIVKPTIRKAEYYERFDYHETLQECIENIKTQVFTFDSE